MSTDPLQESARTKIAKSLITALAIIGVAIASFVLATYVWDWIGARLPLANLAPAILFCVAGIVVTSMSIHSRASWRGSVEIGALALACTIGALFWGFIGVVIAAVLVFAIEWLLKRSRKSRLITG